ncbi:adenosylmethionine-8-amino-7-oxononanoate aminotransferase [Brevibacterium sanguinis]|uniref:Adenosylmethionine-8-amino-7-oxononanoate aminotransferase n=2 Tax=Brevibacterium TaxID=1696 RepID=A0A366IN52_9MICO|nr:MULTISPECIES: aspartate aminotransferase family protein [Brevibacterium]RBP68088.1 adenosylmethionine-8-amino-7-oxononanoate aminotransferase [Brevibacterium sanguinis]RBP74495.1 adenosylmethionine-8-amino-7-oxononanoate aminotransferase [Brevibacterium celere]
MTTTLPGTTAPTADDQSNSVAARQPSALQEQAQKHLIMHFTGAEAYDSKPPAIMSRGEGCWIEDETGRRYFDALAGLFCVQVGYSHGGEIGEAVKSQMSALPYYTNWGAAHPPAVQLATKLAELAPEGLERVFFTSGGGESNESAVKLIRQYHQARGESSRTKFIARRVAYHGTSYAALSINGMTAFRKPFEPLMHGVRHVSNTKRYMRPVGETDEQMTKQLIDEIESLILQEGADTVAGIFVEPLQNAGGSLVPPQGYCEELRRISDKYGVLLVADEVISGFGRLGEWFASTRFGLRPDIITFAKGIASGHVPLGGMIATNDVVDTVLNGPAKMYMHGLTYGGSPSACAAALANISIMEREGVLANVRANESHFRERLQTLSDVEFVGDVRGAGFHYSIELVTDKADGTWSGTISADDFVNGHLSPALNAAGILCRVAVDHGGTPLVQFSPPLIMTREEVDWLVERVREVFTDLVPLLHS